MSISSMTNDFTATIKRQVATYSASKAKILSYTTAKRTADGLSISISASFQGLSSEEKAQYGVNDTNMSWCMYTATDPVLQTEDQVTWTDDGGVVRVCRVSGPSFSMAGKGRIWLAIVSETKNET